MLLFTHHYPARCFGMNMPKSHCRRQSGMNFGYVTVNGVNSNEFWLVCAHNLLSELLDDKIKI